MSESPTAKLNRADLALVEATIAWSIDHDRARADRELREAVFVHRQVMEDVRDGIRALVR